MRRRTALLVLVLAAALPLRAQKLATGVDMAWLAAGMADVGAELSIGRAASLSVSLLACQHPWVHRDISGLAFQPEVRYYLSGRSMYHHFVGVGAIIGGYDMGLDIGHYQGSAAGVGLTFGYVLPLGDRWNVDLHSGFGIVHTQDRHHGHDNYTIPTKFGVTIAYIVR